jgi:hypothetical protein
MASSVDPKLPPSIVHAETQDSLGLVCWLWRREMIAKCEASIDEIAAETQSAALSKKQRQEQEARILADMLTIEHGECSLIRAAEAQGEVIDFRSDTAPAAVLGVELVQRAGGNGVVESSLEMVRRVLSPG